MAGISGLSFNNFYGMGSGGVSTLFSSMNNNVSGVSSLSGLTSDFSSIRNGSYGKLLKSYYNQNSATSTDKSSSTSKASTSVSRKNQALSDIKSNADSLKTSADKLTSTASGNVFEKKTDGSYDTDAIYDAVSSFVKDYNSTLSATSNTSKSSVANAVSDMRRTTSVMSNSLSKMGITAGADGKLSIDEETFKKADMSKVKTMFNGSSSYAANVSSTASRLSGSASNSLSSATGSTYSSKGTYSSYASSLFNSYT